MFQASEKLVAALASDPMGNASGSKMQIPITLRVREAQIALDKVNGPALRSRPTRYGAN
jgi:hypothetical protein